MLIASDCNIAMNSFVSVFVVFGLLFVDHTVIVNGRAQFSMFPFPSFGGFPSMQQPTQSSNAFPFSSFGFPSFGQQAATSAPTFQWPQFPQFGQMTGQPTFPWLQPGSAATTVTSPNQAALANYVSPNNRSEPQNLYPQLTKPAGRVPVSGADYVSRQNTATKQALMQKLAKFPDYPEPMVAAGKTSVQYGGPPADAWGNYEDEDFDPQTGQLLVPNEHQNPPPLISNPPSPDDVTQNF